MPDQVTWDDTQPCQICEGKGWVFEEDPASQAQVGWQTCGYCHGTGHAGWVAEKRQDRHARSKRTRTILIVLTVILLMSNEHPVSPAMNWFKLALWLPLLAWWFWWAINRPVSQRARRRAARRAQHAPGFNTGKEAAAVGAVLAGAFLKAGLTRRKSQVTDGLGRRRFDLDD